MEPDRPDDLPTPNLMARYWDDDYLRALMLMEEESGEVTAGPDYGNHLGQFIADPQGFKEMERLKFLVFRSLNQLLLDCDLGAGHSAAFRCGKKLLFNYLQLPTLDQQEQLWQALELDAGGDLSAKNTIDPQLTSLICELLTATDWATIATAASESLQQQMIDQWPLLKTA
jgi:hypothetical protein